MRALASSETLLKWTAPRVPRNAEERRDFQKGRVLLSVSLPIMTGIAPIVGFFQARFHEDPTVPCLGIAFSILVGVGAYYLLGSMADKSEEVSCKVAPEGVCLGTRCYRYEDIRYARLWEREERKLVFLMLSLVRRNWIIRSVAVAAEIPEEALRGLLAQRFPVLRAPPTEHEQTMSRLVPGTWRMLIGVPFFLAGMFLALVAFGLGEKALSDPDPGTRPGTQPMASTLPAESHPVSPPEDAGSKARGRLYFWLNIEMSVAVALASASCLLAGGLFFVWDRTFRLRQRVDYLASRLAGQECPGIADDPKRPSDLSPGTRE